MSELTSVAVVVAALVSGIIFGFNLGTEVESKVRGYKKPLFSIFPSASLLGLALNQVFSLLIVSTVMVAVAVLILRVGNAYPLSQNDRYVFVIIWFASIAFAKYLRYNYWKRKSEK